MFNMWPFLVLNALNGVKNLMQHKGKNNSQEQSQTWSQIGVCF